MLAGVSVEYYAKLERGDLVGASVAVLTSIADALLLDDAERDHLFDLAKEANASPVRKRRMRSSEWCGRGCSGRSMGSPPVPRSSAMAEWT